MSNRSKLIFILFLYNSYSYGLDVSSNTSINGFGTLGGSYNSNENILFRLAMLVQRGIFHLQPIVN